MEEEEKGLLHHSGTEGGEDGRKEEEMSVAIRG